MKILLLMFLPVCYAATVLGQTTAEGLYQQAWIKSIRNNSGDLESAITDLNNAIKLNPDYHEAYNQRAVVKAQQGDLDGAWSDYSTAIELSPGFATYYLNRAGIRDQKKDVVGALADCSRAIELNPRDQHAYQKRGELRLKQKDYAGAIADFTQALEVKPDFFAVLKSRAAAYWASGQSRLADADQDKYAAEMQKFTDRLGIEVTP